MHNSSDKMLKTAIDEMLRDFRIEDKLTEVTIQTMWPDMVGKTIAKQTKGLYLRNGVLYIVLLSAALREEISYSKTKIAEKINRKLGGMIVKEVVVK
jgi:predicted nucleic acid-binding Zn ribbon protein